MRILTFYVLTELTKVFLVALIALTLVMLLIGVVNEGMQQHLPLMQVLQLIPCLFPHFLRMTIPVTLLLACTTVYARMSGANEVVAIKAMGISPMVILWPILALGFFCSLGAVWLNDLAGSWGERGAQQVVVNHVEEIVYSMLESQRCYSSPYFSINVKRVEGRRLIRVILTLPTRGSSPAVTITAEEAEIRTDPAEQVLKIFLRKGRVDVAGKLKAEFDVYEQEIPLIDASRTRSGGRPASWVPMCEVEQEVAQQRVRIDQLEQALAARAAFQMLTGEFDELAGPEWPIRQKARQHECGQLHRLLTEPPRRWSAGFGCLCFVWVGAPMAIRMRNRDFLTSFFLCFLPILVVYYPLLMYFIGAAKGGTLPPWTVWTCNLLLAVWGAWLLRRVIRY